MTATPAPVATAPTPPRGQRLVGPDVVRAVALVGVVLMNYHGYLVIRGGTVGDDAVGRFFDPFRGPLATRFAATFVLVAGVGVALLSRRAADDTERRRAVRWSLLRRGVLLYTGGLLLDLVWPGTILPFYGGMFACAAVLAFWRSRWLVLTGVAAALAGAAIAWWRYERDRGGHDTSWLTNPGSSSVRGVAFDLFVNGTHPLLPWLAFFCAGIVVGRVLDTAWWRPVAIAAGTTLFTLALLANATATTDRARFLLSLDPPERGLAYTASALGSALVAFGGITWLAERFAGSRVVDVLARAGRTSLSLYVAHALLFDLVVDWLGWVEPGGLGTALVMTAAFWTIGIAAAAWWTRRYGRGPLERLDRAFTR